MIPGRPRDAGASARTGQPPQAPSTGVAGLEESGHEELAQRVRFLSRAANLGEPGATVETVETHFAWVFMTPRHAFKLRKPMRYHSIDTRTPASRRASALRDIVLNRDLAPGIYLAVLPLLREPDGLLRLGRPGETGNAVDWVLRMRRLQPERMFDFLAITERLQATQLAALYECLHRFYTAGRIVRVNAPEYLGRFEREIEESCDALGPITIPGLERSQIADLRLLYGLALQRLRDTLARRASAGCIRDCHGDLRPEHIWIGPPVFVIDRLDFDERQRWLDPLEELCFLLLECERLGFPSPGRQLLVRYMKDEGIGHLGWLADFYIADRATERARLAAWRCVETQVPAAHWAERVAYYVNRALRALAFARG